MKITNALMGEHAVFYAQLGHLGGAARRYSTPADAATDAAVLGAALEDHARLEEDLLFLPMESHMGGDGPLTVLREEHAEILALLARAQGNEELSRAKSTILDWVELAHGHFAKEEEGLFPAADDMLPEERLVELGASWADRRFRGTTAAQRTAAGR